MKIAEAHANNTEIPKIHSNNPIAATSLTKHCTNVSPFLQRLCQVSFQPWLNEYVLGLFKIFEKQTEITLKSAISYRPYESGLKSSFFTYPSIKLK